MGADRFLDEMRYGKERELEQALKDRCYVVINTNRRVRILGAFTKSQANRIRRDLNGTTDDRWSVHKLLPDPSQPRGTDGTR